MLRPREAAENQTMCDRLERRCADEVERYVAELVANHKRGGIVVAIPIFCGPVLITDVPRLLRLNRAGERARALFSRHGPAWAQPLPLSESERIGFFLSDNLLLHLVALYSNSLQGRDYDYLGHLLFFDYARAVMADPRTPEYLREDPALRAEFPAKPIAGLDERGRWRPLPTRVSQILEAPIPSGFLIPGRVERTSS